MDDDQSVRKHLKVFVGGLPTGASEHQVGTHFARFGHVVSVSVVPPKEGDGKKALYAFVTFKFAADADCSVVDTQHFPGVTRPLAMGFATPRRKDAQEAQSKAGLLSETDPCKVFVGGISDKDREDEVGDFFSQWGLVALVYRDPTNWGFVQFATKEGALRLLQEGNIVFQRRRLDIKASDSKRVMEETERQELIRRAIARHFHKKNMTMMAPPGAPQVPPGSMPPGAPPGAGYPPAGGYYGGPPPAGYYGSAPPGYYGVPPGGPPAGYPTSGYPPPGYLPPGYPQGGYYGTPPAGGYYGSSPQGGTSAPALGAPPPSGGEAQRALPPPDYYRSGSRGSADPYASTSGSYPAGDPRSAYPPPTGSTNGPQTSSYAGYYRDSRDHDAGGGGGGGGDRRRTDEYYRSAYPPPGPPNAQGPPGEEHKDRQDGYSRSASGCGGGAGGGGGGASGYVASSDPYYHASSQAPPPSSSGGYYAHPSDGYSGHGPPPGAYGAAPTDPYSRNPPDHRYAHDARYQPY